MASSPSALFHHGIRLLSALGRNCRRAGVCGPAKTRGRAKGAGEGDCFLKLTQDREHDGEVAHSDAFNAELQGRERHDCRNAPAGIRFWRRILNARATLAIAVAGGVLSPMVLSLVFTPAVHYCLERRNWFCFQVFAVVSDIISNNGFVHCARPPLSKVKP